MNYIKGFKLPILTLCVALILSFAACGKDKNDEYTASDKDTSASDTDGGSSTPTIDLEEDIFEKPDSDDSGKDTAATPSVDANGDTSKDSNSKEDTSKDSDSKDDDSKKEESKDDESDKEETSSKNNVGEITEDGKIKLPTVWFD